MIEFQVKAEAVNAKLASLVPEGPEVTRALMAFARVLETKIRLGFSTSTSPYGQKWKPLAIRKGQPLVNTTNLKKNVRARQVGSSVVVGSNLRLPGNPNSLGAVHQFGMTIKPKSGKFLVFPGMGGAKVFAKEVTIPARPFMPITPAGQVKLPATWEKAAINAMAKALKL